MIRSKPLQEQIDFLNQVLTAMDENKLDDEQMKYVDAYLVHLEKEQDKKKLQEQKAREQEEAQDPGDVLEEVGSLTEAQEAAKAPGGAVRGGRRGHDTQREAATVGGPVRGFQPV